MKKIGIVFVAALALGSFTGCKKKGGDCAASINGMMDRMMADQMKAGGDKVTPEMKKMADEMMKKMSGAMIKVCQDDKWSADALKCMDDAKDEASAKKCDGMLTPDQKKHVDEAMAKEMGMGDMGGGKHGGDDKPPAPPAGDDKGGGGAASGAPAAPPAGDDKGGGSAAK